MGLWKFILKILGCNKPSVKTTTTTTLTDQTTTKGCQKRALCIGINDYPGTSNDLRGCVNDARGWRSMFDQLGFCIVKILVDASATPKNVKDELLQLVKLSESGDVLAITYSGHGTTTPDLDGDEDDGRDEAICLYGGLMIDDEIRSILKQVKEGVKVTFISDSCHSGTVTRAFLSAINNYDVYAKSRYLPPKDDIEAISLGTLPLKKGVFIPENGMKEILLAGCKSTEYSYDAFFNGMNMGAFSHYALLILRDNPRITYNDFYKKVRTYLPNGQYPQTPQLEGSAENKNSYMFE